MFGQDFKSTFTYEDLMNYPPTVDTIAHPELTSIQTVTIAGLGVHMAMLDENDTENEEELKTMTQLATLLATAFYYDKKYILLQVTGGVRDCEAKLTVKEVEHIAIAYLNFCETCTGAMDFTKMIVPFNTQMKKLLHLTPTP